MQALQAVVEAVDLAGREYTEAGERALNKALNALGIPEDAEFGPSGWETLYGADWRTVGLRVNVGSNRYVDLIVDNQPGALAPVTQ